MQDVGSGRRSLTFPLCFPSELHHGRRAEEGAPPRPGGVLHRPHGALHGAGRRPRSPRLHVLLHRPVRRERPVEGGERRGRGRGGLDGQGRERRKRGGEVESSSVCGGGDARKMERVEEFEWWL